MANTRVCFVIVSLDIANRESLGTWVPLSQGVIVAQKYNVYNILKPIFEFEPGADSPPPAPKHQTAASNKPKAPREPGTRKVARKRSRPQDSLKPNKPEPKQAQAPVVNRREPMYENYDNISDHLHDDDTPDEATIGTRSVIDEDEDYRETGHRRRTQTEYTRQDQAHRVWADQLLDYYLLLDSDPAYAAEHRPQMPDSSQIDRPVDTDAHTALHWACAMGDIDVAKELLLRKANVHARNVRGETPLIRAGLFANCFDKGTWPKMVHILQHTIMIPDYHGGTVFHHVALTASGGSKATRAKHYLDVLLNKLSEMISPTEFLNFLNMQDRNGNTAFHMAARLSRRCCKLFQAYGLPSDIPNNEGETAQGIMSLKAKERSKMTNRNPVPSSSPAPAGDLSAFTNNQSPSKFNASLGLNSAALKSLPSQSFSRSLNTLVASQLTSFLEAGEADMEEKDALLNDIARATERTNKEASLLRQKSYGLTASLDNGEDNEDLRAEFEALLVEGEKLEEQVQHRQIHKLVHLEENAALMQKGSAKSDIKLELSEREVLGHELHEEQDMRLRFVRDLVLAEANAGMRDGGQHLMWMVSNLLGKSTDEVAGVIDEILEDLEASRGGGPELVDTDLDG